MVPTHFVRLLALPEEVRARYDVSSMKLVGHTGAACPIDVKREMIEWWGPVFFDAYGATEVGTTCMITSEEWLEHPGSVGPGRSRRSPRSWSTTTATSWPRGTEGRLFFEDATGRGVVYPNDPAEDAPPPTSRPGVFTLGEIGYLDDDGYVYITDRFSDMIVSGGVEHLPGRGRAGAASSTPAWPTSPSSACPTADMGEEVKALVVPADPADPPGAAELIACCRERLSGYKCPRSVDIVDTVGRTTMGKVNKRALRAPYWDSARTIGG